LSEYGDKLDCRNCDDRLKQERGCSEAGDIGFWIGRQRVFRCPLSLISQLSYDYIKAYSFYEKGFMPNGGGWVEESNRYIQAMMIISNEYNKIYEKSIEKIKNGRARPKHNT